MTVMLLVLCLGFASAKTPADTVRILAIGNSFSQDAVEQYFFELAQDAGIPVIVGNAYIGGCSIERHVLNSRSGAAGYAYRKVGKGGSGERKEYPGRTLAEIIADEPWDYVSLQQASPFSGIYDSYAQWLPELYGYVKERVPEDTQFMRQNLSASVSLSRPGPQSRMPAHLLSGTIWTGTVTILTCCGAAILQPAPGSRNCSAVSSVTAMLLKGCPGLMSGLRSSPRRRLSVIRIRSHG